MGDLSVYPGFDAYPPCGECHGGRFRFFEPGALALDKSTCGNCGGSGHEPERRPVLRDRNGIAWIETAVRVSNPTGDGQ